MKYQILAQNPLTDEISKREKNLAEYDERVANLTARKEELERAKLEIAIEEENLSKIDKCKISDEIKAFVEYGEKLGFVAICGEPIEEAVEAPIETATEEIPPEEELI